MLRELEVLFSLGGLEVPNLCRKIHKGRFYTVEEFKWLFKRDGTLQVVRKVGSVKCCSVTNAKKAIVT